MTAKISWIFWVVSGWATIWGVFGAFLRGDEDEDDDRKEDDNRKVDDNNIQ
jgi:hypothetical protein